jgi:hypothetical protein
MRVVEILKRKDGSSVVVAVVLAIIVAQAVQGLATRPAEWLSGVSTQGGGWRTAFWLPLLNLVVALLVFELLTRVYLIVEAGQAGTRKK